MMVLMSVDMEIIYDFYYFSYLIRQFLSYKTIVLSYKTIVILVTVGTDPLFFRNIKYF